MKRRDETIERVRTSANATCDALARDLVGGGDHNANAREGRRSMAMLLDGLVSLFDDAGGGRELALVRTKLEEASLWFQAWRRRTAVDVADESPAVPE